jgi:hypothetical protein
MRLPHRFYLLALCCTAILIAGSTIPCGGTSERETTETVETPASGPIAAITMVVAALGGLVAVLGVVVAIKGVAGKSDVTVALSKSKQVALKKISQGALMTLIGAGVMLGAVRFFPKERREIQGKEKTTTTTTRTFGPDSGRAEERVETMTAE